uniref:Uncharacterized protein n=1 Tax=viral metagenome TaxID=1070528 RepID=A0A6C0EEA6_9ZZZZ
MSNFFNDQYINHFNAFIQQLKQLFVNVTDTEINIESELKLIEELNDQEKINRGMQFNMLITDELFNLFIKSKIKIFSYKNSDTLFLSECLFGNNLSLKNLLNNQPDPIKKIIWKNLHILYIVTEFLKPIETQNTEKMIQLNNLVKNNENNSKNNNFNYNKNDQKINLQKMLGVDTNNQTSEMIDDIINSFDNILNGESNTNPLIGIMEISQKISSKYSDQINKGDIELDKIIQSIVSKIPGMDKIMTSLMIPKNNQNVDQNTKIIIDEQFSTANVKLGHIDENNESNMKIGNILKMADQFGVIPGGKKKINNSDENQESNIFNNLLGGLMNGKGKGKGNDLNDFINGMSSGNDKDPSNNNLFTNLFENLSKGKGKGIEQINGLDKIGKMMDIMKNLEKSKSKNDIGNIKKEMDNLLINDFGIDINKLNEDMKKNFNL